MIRVSDAKTVCKICGKTDWCLVSEDGQAAICQRISDGAVKKAGKAGWLHVLGDDFKPEPPKVEPKPEIEWRPLWEGYRKAYLKNKGEVTKAALDWKLDPYYVSMSGAGWDDGWMMLPMVDGNLKIVGLQKRKGPYKRFVKHSNIGLFVSSAHPYDGVLFICEGWSDMVALTSLGFPAIGKPNCFCGDEDVKLFVESREFDKIVVMADHDQVGLDGAKQTRKALGGKAVIARPSGKDVKDSVEEGSLTRTKLAELLRSMG